jgi:hypothetical protein
MLVFIAFVISLLFIYIDMTALYKTRLYNIHIDRFEGNSEFYKTAVYVFALLFIVIPILVFFFLPERVGV